MKHINLLVALTAAITSLPASAQITKNYKLKDLIGKQIVGLVNLPKKQIANIQSEFLILGAIDGNSENVVIIQPQSITENGSIIC